MIYNRLLIILLLVAGTLGAAEDPLRLGLNLRWGPGDAATLRERFRKARALGIREVRLDWEWRAVEQRPGEYRWERLDTLVECARAAGVALLPIVHYAPDWALRRDAKAPGIYQLAPDEASFPAYARFLLASVRRYGLDGAQPIRHWQVWNEPNLPQFWGPRPDPGAYARLLRTVHRTLAPVRDQVRLVHAGLAKSDVAFLHALWAQDPALAETFDVMAVHSYVFDGRDGVRTPEAMDADDAQAALLGFVGSLHDPGYLGKVFNLRLFLDLRQGAGKPIWITEMGYFVGPAPLGLDEAGQAARLTSTVDFIRRRLTDRPFGDGLRARAAGVERLYWFALEDYPAPPGEASGAFGLYRPDGSLRPAGARLRELAR